MEEERSQSYNQILISDLTLSKNNHVCSLYFLEVEAINDVKFENCHWSQVWFRIKLETEFWKCTFCNW